MISVILFFLISVLPITVPDSDNGGKEVVAKFEVYYNPKTGNYTLDTEVETKHFLSDCDALLYLESQARSICTKDEVLQIELRGLKPGQRY